MLVLAIDRGDDLTERQPYVVHEGTDLIEPETIPKITQPEYRCCDKEYQKYCVGWESRICVWSGWLPEQGSASVNPRHRIRASRN